MATQTTDLELRIRAALEGIESVTGFKVELQNTGEATAKLTQDAAELDSALEDLNGLRQQIQQQRDLQAQLNDTRAAYEAARAKQRELSDAVVESLGPTRTQLTEQARATTEVQRLEKHLERTREQQRELTRRVIEADEPNAKLTQRHVDLTRRLEAQERALSTAKTRQDAANQAVAAGSEPNQKLIEKHERQTDTVEELAGELTQLEQALRREEAALNAAGIASGEFDAAATKIDGTLEQARRELQQNAEASRALSDAYSTLGVRSAGSLQQVATAARQAFDTIRSSGTASVRDLDLAFEGLVKAELEAARAAGTAQRDITAGMLKSQASTDAQRQAVDRLNRELDETAVKGKSVGTQIGGALRTVAALAGVSIGTQLVRELGELADQAKSVEARLRLATDSEEEFQAAQQGALEVAQRTSASLEGTAVLYSRLDDAVRKTGGTQQDTLEVTEAINQALAISGGNAQSTEAAITQLAQGLAAGALRGEEFNSVAEQAPRLLQVLEDSLGVTRGELRKMAEEGQLTTEVVVSAIQQQSDKLAGEFEKIPLRLGQALQQLRNTLVVATGEMDKTTGASTAVAEAIAKTAQVLLDLSQNKEVQAGIRGLGDLVGVTFDKIAVAFNTLQAIFFGAATAISAAATIIARALAAITPGDLGDRFSAIADSLEQRTRELADKTAKNMDEARASFVDLIEGGASAVTEFGRAAGVVEHQQEQLKTKLEETGKAGQDAADGIGAVGDPAVVNKVVVAAGTLDSLKESTDAAAQATDELTEAQKKELEIKDRMLKSLDERIQKEKDAATASRLAAQQMQQDAEETAARFRDSIGSAATQDQLEDLRVALSAAFADGEIAAEEYQAQLKLINEQGRQLVETFAFLGQFNRAGIEGIEQTSARIQAAAEAAYRSTYDYVRRAIPQMQTSLRSYNEAVATARRAAQNLVNDYLAQQARAGELAEQLASGYVEQARVVDGMIQRVRVSGQDMIDVAQRATAELGLLDEQELSGLRSAIDAARNSLLDLRDAASDTLASVTDDLDRLLGKEEEIEKRRQATRLAEVQRQLEAARAAGDAQAIRDLEAALGIQQQIFDITTKRLDAEIRARELAARELPVSSRSGSSEVSPAKDPRPDATTTTRREIVLSIPGVGRATVSATPAEAARLEDLLESLQRSLSVAGGG